ncbi:MAG: hypothetical protein HYS17_11780 [Micavibrio aeruginosavorus]|uniref:GGDEF domain-containing protein n=1 Tax=Micavibrio aeruginosavorus TaxID=349221 RepID=A0A7T5R294_9BACT|nr:MAG: hypothetical protein HYS17_11780 [Micavibrio aeruginosavorus]
MAGPLNPSEAARRAAAEVSRVVQQNPNAAASFAGHENVQTVLRDIEALDRNFSQTGGVFFRAGGNPLQTAEDFTRIHIEQYRETGRPSLPALAMHHAEKLGLDKNSPEYKAMILVSARAEMRLASTPDYHSQFHYTDVAAYTANLLEKNNDMVGANRGGTSLSKKEQALTFIAAIGHDLDHDGHGNPPHDPLFNEEKSFDKMLPLLQEAGLAAQDIKTIHTILKTTSPNGPHAVLKEAAQAQREGRPADWGKVDKDNKFADLQAALERDPKMTQMAAMVSDADLAGSSLSMKSNKVLSELLTAEVRKAGGNLDFTTDGARKFFLDNIVGKEGFASDAGRETANDAFMALRKETEQRLAAAAAAPKPAEPPLKPKAVSFDAIMEGDEVKRYLQQFILPDDARAEAQKRNPGVQYPQNTDDVLRDVKGVWEKKGFLSPAELRSELIRKYLPDSDPALKKFVEDMELSRNRPEVVTGYMKKEHAYSATGLAHLYAKEMNKPIAMAEVDFSNMGGTNDEYRRRIAAERNVPVEAVNKADAEHMTDRAVKVLSDSMVDSLRDGLPPGAKIIPIRTGGDELRLIFTGVDDPDALKKLTDSMHNGVEKKVAGMGLQDHPHLKAPDDPVRNGFGAALAIQDMRKIENPHNIIQELDDKIKAAKTRIGHERLGTVDEASIRSDVAEKIDKGELKVADGVDRQTAIDKVVNDEIKKSKIISAVLRHDNPLHNPNLKQGLAGTQAYIEKVAAQAGTTPIVHADVPDAIAKSDPVGARRPVAAAPLAGIDERRAAIALENVKPAGRPLSGAEKFFVEQSAHALTPVDPSAQALMPNDIPKMVEMYAAENEEFKRQFDPSDPDVRQGLAKAGLKGMQDVSPHVMAVSFHNLAGLNNDLGHHNADLVLRHFGNDIIENSMKKAGFDAGAGPKPYTIAHHGGGNFSVLMKPAAVGADGKPVFMSPDMIKGIEKDIASRVEELNRQPVDKFLEQRGVHIDEDLRAHIDKKGLKSFADIGDPKDRDLSTDRAVKGRVNGIRSVVESAPVKDPAGGAAQISAVREQADKSMGALRDSEIMQQNGMQKPSASQPGEKSTPAVVVEAVPVAATAVAAVAAVVAADVDAEVRASTETPRVDADALSRPMPARLEGRMGSAGSGVGVGMGVYSLTEKFGEGGTAKADLANKETRTLAQAGIAADVSAIAVDGGDGLRSLKAASQTMQSASKLGRVAAPVGVALSVASGAIDYKIAEKQGDGKRAAEAISGTTGGVAGAAAGGIVGAKAGAAAGAAIGAFFGVVGAAPGAVIGGFIGGIGGAIAGAWGGSKAGNKVGEAVGLQEKLQAKFDADKKEQALTVKSADGPSTRVAAQPAATPKASSPGELRAYENKMAAAAAPKVASSADLRAYENKTAGGPESSARAPARTTAPAVDVPAKPAEGPSTRTPLKPAAAGGTESKAAETRGAETRPAASRQNYVERPREDESVKPAVKNGGRELGSSGAGDTYVVAGNIPKVGEQFKAASTTAGVIEAPDAGSDPRFKVAAAQNNRNMVL